MKKLQVTAPITLFAGQAGPGHTLSPPQAFPEQMPRASHSLQLICFPDLLSPGLGEGGPEAGSSPGETAYS